MVAGGVLGLEVALDRRRARRAGRGLREAVRAGRRGAAGEAAVPRAEHVHGEAPGMPHAPPRERVARRAERDQRRLERDGGERADDQPERRAVDLRRDERDAGGEAAEGVAQGALVEARRAGWMAWAAACSVQGGLAAERDVAEQLVGAVGAERVHEAAGADVAVRARERVAVEVAGAAGERERAVDDARRRPR